MTALLTAEFRKVLSLRYWWILGIAPLLVGLFCGALTLPVMRQLEDVVGEDFAEAAAAAVGISLALALVFLFAALFGVVNTGSDMAQLAPMVEQVEQRVGQARRRGWSSWPPCATRTSWPRPPGPSTPARLRRRTGFTLVEAVLVMVIIGIVGSIVAVFILRIVRLDLTLLSVDPNVTTIVEGTIMAVVVMLGGILAVRGRRA